MNIERIEALVQKVQSIPDLSARGLALELVQAVMELHASGLERMMEIANGPIADAYADDALVSGLLLLHDLHPLGLETRVLRALDRPSFRSRGASVELVSIADGAVRVRVEGGAALSSAVEDALYEAAPDAASILVEGAAAGFVPLEQLIAR